MKVKPLEKDDEKKFLSMCKDFYSSNATARTYDAKIAKRTFDYYMSKHENVMGYLLEEEGTDAIIGYSLVSSYWCNEDGGNRILLDELYISPKFRHKGYAHMFLKWLQEEFKDKAVFITLEVNNSNTEAKKLYSTMGFEHDAYTRDGFEVLAKPLLLTSSTNKKQ